MVKGKGGNMGYYQDSNKMITKKDIGLAIMTLRKKAGIKTQEELGRKLKHKRAKGTINKIETGSGNYSIDILFDIADVLKCYVSDFFGTKEKSTELSMIENLIKNLVDEKANKETRMKKC